MSTELKYFLIIAGFGLSLACFFMTFGPSSHSLELRTYTIELREKYTQKDIQGLQKEVATLEGQVAVLLKERNENKERK